MPRVRSLSPIHESAEAQIDAAVLRLVDLFARQAAWELASDAHLVETQNATKHIKED